LVCGIGTLRGTIQEIGLGYYVETTAVGAYIEHENDRQQ
jgi:hypothetical protein